MGLFEETHEFSPIHIPISTRMDELRTTYRIYMQNGDVQEIKANSAAEAVEQLNFPDGILRICNAAYETRQMLNANLLTPNGMSIATDISTEDKPKITHIVEDTTLISSPEQTFAFFNLVEYANATAQSSATHITQETSEHQTSNPTIEDQIAPTSTDEETNASPTTSMEASSSPEIDLSPEDVRNLLHSSASPTPDDDNTPETP